MVFIQSTSRLFKQLHAFLQPLKDDAYACPVAVLDQASLGQHMRHIIEFYRCLQEGWEKGTLDYEHRQRDLLLETKKEPAIAALEALLHQFSAYTEDKTLTLRTFYEESEQVLSTNFYREWAYVLEHTIHHMALLRVGAKALHPHLVMPADFGVAESTMRYRRHHAAPS